ncbi:hypothetical protein V6N11_051634 [Hibiscus sabdariffa]|uniref:UBP-type domain-containing protein n=1 Tax=Hibiscus sabdariffa TaxID=183260 RepID=A0ABR2U827_9ROSI
MLHASSNKKPNDVDNPTKIMLENNRAKGFLKSPHGKTPMVEGCGDLTKGLSEWSPVESVISNPLMMAKEVNPCAAQVFDEKDLRRGKDPTTTKPIIKFIESNDPYDFRLLLIAKHNKAMGTSSSNIASEPTLVGDIRTCGKQRALFTLDVQFTGYTGSLDHTSENLWICFICGFVGCGRYKGGYAIIHWKETQHCYSLELETHLVWDYAGENYVHRLIQPKTDGKLVELNSHCLHTNDGCGSCHCVDSGINEAMLSCKAEIDNEETERAIANALNKAAMQKWKKMQAKLERCVQEKNFFVDLNKNLLKNQEIWKAKLLEVEDREIKLEAARKAEHLHSYSPRISKKLGIDVELREVTQLPDRISPINI